MRHLVGNAVTLALGALLLMGATVFAALRSVQWVISNEATVLARLEPAAAHEFDWEALGGRAYESNCQNCHRRSGEGWDQYPGLSQASALLAGPQGRAYFVALHLYGSTSDRWRVPMPPMGHMQDAEVAAVMNHVLTQFGNQVPRASLFIPSDVAAARESPLSPWGVNALRPRDQGQ